MIDFLGAFNVVFDYLGKHISTMLLIGGFFAGFYFIYWFFKGKPEEGETPTTLKVMMWVGVLIGILLLGGGINAWSIRTQDPYQYEWFTVVLVIIVGIALVLRPIKDVPWAAIVGVVVAGFVVFLTSYYLSFIAESMSVILGIEPFWIMVIIFALIFIIVFLAFKMIEGIGKILGAALSSRPASLIIMVLCAVEGILAHWYLSIISLFG